MAEYDISRATGKCSVTGHSFEEGDDFYTVVLESKEGLERRDYSQDAWKGPPEGTLCHFKTRMPKKNEPKKTFVDNEVLINFFLRLSDTEESLKLRFRFVLSLILLRKRLLKYEKTLRDDDREFWEMRLTRDKSIHRVFNPSLNEEEIEELSAELNTVLHGHLAEEVKTSEPSDENDSETAGEVVAPSSEGSTT
ncbi:MAG: hypothetical protein MI923_06975 [Phycisphaerales bacterium]|nr:hypothetical protein [Phycisphaerales bacterium]